MRYKLIILALINTLLLTNLSSQDLQYVRSLVDTLSSSEMHGRGYVNKGDLIAAEFIRDEFINNDVKSFGKSYFQEFPISMNTFPGDIELSIDGVRLSPGKDFVLYSSSPKVSGEFELVWMLADSLGNITLDENIDISSLGKKVIVTNKTQSKFNKEEYEVAGFIYLTDKGVSWHVADGKIVNDYFELQIANQELPANSQSIQLKVKNKYLDAYETQNVVGFIEGKSRPEEFIVFSAHYDHLGRMGSEAIFPGANDNASGTAMILDLAKHYSNPETQPEYSIVFMAFSAEEVGLMGSFHYVYNPLFPLKQIKFLVNLDMVGSGSDGIKVVNGTVFKEAFQTLVDINTENEYLKQVGKRGEAANSDHYPFYTNGVPSFFIYTLGDESKEYHNIYDTPENVPFTEYEDFFKLMTGFVNSFSKESNE